ncbi:hypothetical protein GJAV_G00165500 [Gymnothorax javanicus]|nr:hypothetical protein GJAV_G00165500 [Gymnothorax javanicus]
MEETGIEKEKGRKHMHSFRKKRDGPLGCQSCRHFRRAGNFDSGAAIRANKAVSGVHLSLPPLRSCWSVSLTVLRTVGNPDDMAASNREAHFKSNE